MSFGAFLVVLIGLGCWSVAAVFLIGRARHYSRNARRVAHHHRHSVIESDDRIAAYRASAELAANPDLLRRMLGQEEAFRRQAQRGFRSEVWGERLEAFVRDLAGLMLFIIGFILMSKVLSVGQLAAIVFGPALLFMANWLRLRYRRRRQMWRRAAPTGHVSSGGHFNEVAFYLVGVPVMAVAGALVLIYGLF